MCQSLSPQPVVAIEKRLSATEQIAAQILQSAPSSSQTLSEQQITDITAVADLLHMRVLQHRRRSVQLQEEAQKALQEADRVQALVDALTARLLQP